MTEEPRRSGRATKGQHKNASSSPAPAPKPTKTAKSKPPKKSIEPQQTEEDYDEDDEEIRCICGNNNPKDKRAFIGCDDCGVWQHNVCMGMPEDEDEVPDSYLCEQCGPEDHKETLQAMARGEAIWETRNKIYANEKKMSKNRKGKSSKPGWLKKDLADDAEQPEQEQQPQSQEKEETPSQETGGKRKREEEEVKEEPRQLEVKGEDDEDEKPTRGSRLEKRRKSAAPPDTEHDIVDMDQLPKDRRNPAEALSKTIADDINTRTKAGTFRIPDGHTAKSLAAYYAARIEYALKMNHEDPSNQAYKDQFRALQANLKKNKALLERLYDGSLTADELSTMPSSEMASEELQKERAVMKEALDRQAVAIQQEGPRYRRTHKGDELIEEVNHGVSDSGAANAAPVRERTSVVDTEMVDAGSPTTTKVDAVAVASPTEGIGSQPLRVDTKRRESTSASAHERRQSSQQFDMNNIWAKTAQSPTQPSTGPRPMQMPPRRRSSQHQQESAGIKDDADIDRMLQDDDEDSYFPADYTAPDAIVWRGQIIQGADNVHPTVNARYVAGRDISSTVSWRDLLPSKMAIDGRLRIDKAEEYLCSLQYSNSSDVSVLALTPYDDLATFETLFTYFKSRERYAVVKNDKPAMAKDLYIIPVEPGQELPEHISLLEFNRLGSAVEERMLLATFVISRSPDTPSIAQAAPVDTGVTAPQQQGGVNGHSIPQHMRAGPAGSPLNTSSATFSPTANNTAYPGQQPPGPSGSQGLPPNPYASTPPQSQPAPPLQVLSANPLVADVLGSLQHAPTAIQVVNADPGISKEKLHHLKQIMEDDPRTRTDIQALFNRLTAE